MLRHAGLALVLAGAALVAAAEGSRTPKPVIEPAAKGGQCVADPAFMRRNHMELLKHQRDDTVRSGLRAGAFSLKGCIECHANTQTRSVAASATNFCVSCHSYAAVKIDCFECHAATAKAPGTAFHPQTVTGPSPAGALRLPAQVRTDGRAGALR